MTELSAIASTVRFPRLGELGDTSLVPPHHGPLRDSIAAPLLDTDLVMNAIRLFLVDDEPHVRRGLRMRLEMEPDFEIVGESGDGYGAVSGVLAAQPDVVLMDIELPGQDGLRAASQLAATTPETKVVMVSMRDDPATRAEARAAGAAAFIGKHEIDFALTRAIRAVAGSADARKARAAARQQRALSAPPEQEAPM